MAMLPMLGSRVARPLIKCNVGVTLRLSSSVALPPPPDFAPRRRVVVTGIGLATPYGVGTSPSWQGMLSGKAATKSLEGKEFEGQPCRVAATIPRGKGEGEFDVNSLSYAPASRTAPFVQLALICAQEALDDAKLSQTMLGDSEEFRSKSSMYAVCVGTGIGSLDDIVISGAQVAEGLSRKVSPFFVPKVLANMAGAQIAIRHGLRGPNHTMVTACAAGAHNIVDAAKLIAMGEADVALAGGSESCVTPLAITGFARAKSLATNFNDDPGQASRPFDAKRCGFVMGEGAGVMVLEEMEHAKRRGARIYAELRGWGSSGDAYHITSPAEDGEGAARAMKAALAQAGLTPQQVGHINCHATSTPMGDACEGRAIVNVFQGISDLQVTSLKGGIGHLLGAAGAVESAATVLSLYHKCIPPTVNFQSASEDIPAELRIVHSSAAQVPDDFKRQKCV